MSAVLTFMSIAVQNPFLKSSFRPAIVPAVALALLLCACTPKFDWREVRGSDAPFIVLLPGKPASSSREMQLDGVMLKMQMTAADVEGVSFAVGSARVDDASKIPGVLAAMQKGMLSNIHGIPDEKQSGKDIVAFGNLQNGQPVKLVGRFVARGAWVYQVIIIGKEKSLTPEVVDTFMTSFKTS